MTSLRTRGVASLSPAAVTAARSARRRPQDVRAMKNAQFTNGEDRSGSCAMCGSDMTKYVRRQRYCSTACANRRRNVGPTERTCRNCTKTFVRKDAHDSNRQHCSEACARASAKKSRFEFKRRHPQRETTYRKTQRAKNLKDTALERLWRKYPFMPRACEGCGESRVLDIAHRPEHRRNGAWKTMGNTTPEKVWVLCPNCHALLDRLHYTADQLGIKERQVA